MTFADSAYRIDTRVTAFNVPPLHIITADRGLVEIGAVVYLRVRDAIASICQVHTIPRFILKWEPRKIIKRDKRAERARAGVMERERDSTEEMATVENSSDSVYLTKLPL